MSTIAISKRKPKGDAKLLLVGGLMIGLSLLAVGLVAAHQAKLAPPTS